MQPFDELKSVVIRTASISLQIFDIMRVKKYMNQVVEMYSDMIYRLAFSRTQNKADAEDITQEVFLRYLKADKKFNDEEHRKAWLLRVTINAGKSYVTAAWHRHRADIEEASGITEDMAEKSDVFYAVAELPEKYRTVVHLFYYEQLSVKSIGKITGAREGTVKSQLSRAREMLKNKLEEQYEFSKSI